MPCDSCSLNSCAITNCGDGGLFDGYRLMSTQPPGGSGGDSLLTLVSQNVVFFNFSK